jgi:hypothetical protein
LACFFACKRVARYGIEWALQKTPALTPPVWSNVPPHTNLTGVFEIAITNDMGSVSQMFYRVIAVEQE